jgi:glycosyltransferase involved in cell wall biosynthesis
VTVSDVDPGVAMGTARWVREIDTIGVVVPARNEARRLPRCLGALITASRSLRQWEPAGPRVRVIVVVDRSTDRTRQVVRRWAEAETVLSRAGRVGAARAAGVGRLLDSEAARGTPAGRVWIACSDADSVVPPDWLRTQLKHARSGTDMVLGTVRPDPADVSRAVLDAWYRGHVVTDGHPHVHGANLGLRGDSYLAAGGFADIATHEDVLLSRAVRVVGGRVVSTCDSPVITSGRADGRSPGGLADYLRQIGQEQDRMQA